MPAEAADRPVGGGGMVPGPDAPAAALARRVLVIDDHADFREALRILLALHGHEVEAAEDGLRGLDQLRTARFHVAFVDLGLPGLDGYAIARAARAHPDTMNVRLVALTGYGRAEDRRRALAAGFDAHLLKPVDEDALLGVLAEVCLR